VSRKKKLPIELEVQDTTSVTSTDGRGVIGWIVKRNWNKHWSFNFNHKFDFDLSADELRLLADEDRRKQAEAALLDLWRAIGMHEWRFVLPGDAERKPVQNEVLQCLSRILIGKETCGEVKC
jgi:hypothetical protein